MSVRYRLTSVGTVEEEGSWLFTARDSNGRGTEVVLTPCDRDGEPPVEAWLNRCTHEDQRLYREGIGAVIRDGGVVCPKHGSVFDACEGGCENGPADGSTLWSVDISVNRGDVFLTDDEMQYLHDGPAEDEDGDDSGPSSTSHLRF